VVDDDDDVEEVDGNDNEGDVDEVDVYDDDDCVIVMLMRTIVLHPHHHHHQDHHLLYCIVDIDHPDMEMPIALRYVLLRISSNHNIPSHQSS